MGKGITFEKLDGTNLRIGIVRTMWNKEFGDILNKRCKQALLDNNVKLENIVVYNVPGAYELPLGAKILIEKEKVDAVVCLGVLIKGKTMHFEYISEAVAQNISNLAIQNTVPIIYGVLNCLNEEQVWERIQEKGKDHGYEWGNSAVHMANLKNK